MTRDGSSSRPEPMGPASQLGALQAPLDERLAMLEQQQAVRRIWDGDVSVWSDDPSTPEIRDRLGWLRVASTMREHLHELRDLAAEASRSFSRVVLLGMGGASLAPEVLWRAFGRRPGFPSLTVLDSTDPRSVAAVEREGDLSGTLFLVSSKSGTTLESDSLLRYFWAQVPRGEQFVAITDPGTPLAALAAERRFRRTFLNPPDIGGRYSALSYFGLVPAALVGIEIQVLLERGREMARICAADAPAARNAGAWLGAAMAEAAWRGRDKLTFVIAPALASFGLWVEQLIAESTGKSGKGILPVADEPLGPPEVYGDDRIFVGLGAEDLHRDTQVLLQELEAAGHPVVRLACEDCLDLGSEFFRWEFATAVAGAVLRINAFDQPNVAESKKNTLAVLQHPGPISAAASDVELQRLLDAVRPGEYVAILAYLPASQLHDRRLGAVRLRLRDRLHVATTVGYGPRYLHSTGQLHKGGPPKGHFLVITQSPTADVPIPGLSYSFGTLQAAQAEGDLQALRARGRPALRLEGLEALERAVS